MTFTRGVWGAVQDDGLTPYRNHAEDIRAAQWHAHGGKQGILTGGDMTLDPGSLSVTFAPYEALIAERGTDINPDQRGYFSFNDVNTQVTFDPPDASPRNDAVVFAWADPQYGALGPAVDGAGPQIVVVKGTPGVTTPLIDDDINTAIGPGGWWRRADAIINPGDTEVASGNITVHPSPYEWVEITSFVNGWTSGPDTVEVTLDTAGNVHIRGSLAAPGSPTNGDTVFTLGAEHTPQARSTFLVWAPSGDRNTRLEVRADGTVRIFVPPSSGTVWMPEMVFLAQ